MQTRLQRRILYTHEIIFHVDLLALILAHVSGVSRKFRRNPEDVLPRVCKQWFRAWKMLMSTRTPSPMYQHRLYLSHNERELRIQQLSHFEDVFRQSTKDLRDRCFDYLRCKRRGVDTLLGHMVIHMAFSVHTPVDTGVPLGLWRCIDKVREYVAHCISQQRYLSCDIDLILPHWYRITPGDSLHTALIPSSR
jgi:hypothetical protein